MATEQLNYHDFRHSLMLLPPPVTSELEAGVFSHVFTSSDNNASTTETMATCCVTPSQAFEVFIKCFTDTQFLPFVHSKCWILRKYTCSYDISLRPLLLDFKPNEIKLKSVKLYESKTHNTTETGQLLLSESDMCAHGVKVTRPLNPDSSCKNAVHFSIGLLKTSGHVNKEFFMVIELCVDGAQTFVQTPNFLVKTKRSENFKTNTKTSDCGGTNTKTPVIFLSPQNEQKRGRKKRKADTDTIDCLYNNSNLTSLSIPTTSLEFGNYFVFVNDFINNSTEEGADYKLFPYGSNKQAKLTHNFAGSSLFRHPLIPQHNCDLDNVFSTTNVPEFNNTIPYTSYHHNVWGTPYIPSINNNNNNNNISSNNNNNTTIRQRLADLHDVPLSLLELHDLLHKSSV